MNKLDYDILEEAFSLIKKFSNDIDVIKEQKQIIDRILTEQINILIDIKNTKKWTTK